MFLFSQKEGQGTVSSIPWHSLGCRLKFNRFPSICRLFIKFSALSRFTFVSLTRFFFSAFSCSEIKLYLGSDTLLGNRKNVPLNKKLPYSMILHPPTQIMKKKENTSKKICENTTALENCFQHFLRKRKKKKRLKQGWGIFLE